MIAEIEEFDMPELGGVKQTERVCQELLESLAIQRTPKGGSAPFKSNVYMTEHTGEYAGVTLVEIVGIPSGMGKRLWLTQKEKGEIYVSYDKRVLEPTTVKDTDSLKEAVSALVEYFERK